MKRPTLYILIFIIIGIAAGRYADSFTHIALFMMCVAVLSYIITKVYNLKGLMLLPAAALAGYLVCCSAVVPPDKTVDSYIDREIRVSGTVHSVIYNSDEGRVCFVFDGQVFDLGENRGMYDAKVRMRVYGDRPVSVGDMLVIKGRLKALSDRTNPSDFDRKIYMLARKQYYMFYADDVFICERQYGINTFMQTVKENTCRVYYNAMPEKEAGLMCGMMLGETGDIDENLSDLYKKTGIYHVIAISGLHITLLGGVLLKLFSRLGRTAGMAAAMAVLGCYCILTGCSVSVVRAVIMFYIMLIGGFLYYDYDIVSAAALSACILLLYSPYYLFDAGFQLSFSAVLAIGAVGDIAAKFRKYGKVIEATGVNMAVDMVTKPISMFHFYYASPWGIVANFMLVPLMTFAVGLGFIIALSGFISLGVAKILSVPVVIILQSVEAWCEIFVSLPYSYIITGRPALIILFVYAALIIAGYNFAMLNRLKQLCTAGVIFVWICCTKYVCNEFTAPSVTFLNVGQGDCAVGRGDDYCFIVDGGSGGNILLPYLMYIGMDKVDAVFISHMDSDHINGILEILGKIHIGKIYLPSVYDKNENYDELIRLSKQYNINVGIFSEGKSVVFSKTDRMDCLYPYGGTAFGDNNCSMVNKFVCENGSILFTGDIEYEAEDILCGYGTDLRADVLKLAHHGSDTSNSQELLEQVKPVLAIASAKKSVYGHPNEEVLERLDNMEIPCYITENSGAIKVELSQQGLYVRPYLED